MRTFVRQKFPSPRDGFSESPAFRVDDDIRLQGLFHLLVAHKQIGLAFLELVDSFELCSHLVPRVKHVAPVRLHPCFLAEQLRHELHQKPALCKDNDLRTLPACCYLVQDLNQLEHLLGNQCFEPLFEVQDLLVRHNFEVVEDVKN